ncbi:hypothetical protein [Microbacterium sp. H83]|uniref:hypothetical protein n=1 Tax=Microbacterium sp. H83 TaxID=1827324 RepID=UPI0007F3942E|nr:hypothetical protein [Microbacterium sp. H83]OAN36614.1 hypothetical protein A4X16_04210 [Microbacterium sp. H83]
MIGRALRSQARSLFGDVVLLWVAVAAVLMSISMAMSIPTEFRDAPPSARAELAGPFTAILATYAAVLAAVYGSFRYTVDRRDGVIAQRLMLQTRGATLLARAPASAVGGALVALAGVVGGQGALAVAVGGIPLDGGSIGATVALGAVAGLWGMGIGIVVRAHLVALFLVSMSMGAAILLAIVWKAGAVYLPLLAMLDAFRFDLTPIGLTPQQTLDAPVAALVTVAWVLAALLAGALSFLRRDVR